MGEYSRSYTLTTLLKLSSKNRNILLNTLERWVFCYIILKLRVFTNFAQHRHDQNQTMSLMSTG